MKLALSTAAADYADEDSGPRSGLHIRGSRPECSWQVQKQHCAAVIGYPRWNNASLASVAREHGHAAALIEGYRRHGSDVLSLLLGHFVFAVVERDSGRALCAIDRFGVYRLCYAAPRGGGFAFATSADALRAHPGVDATISPQTLYQFLYFIDRVAAPGTIYDEQQKLRPGEAVEFRDGEIRKWRYWQLDYRQPSDRSKPENCQKLLQALEGAVSHSLEGENPDQTAAFLSGGLDSSTVTGFLAHLNSGRGRSVTIAFQHAAFDESGFAETAARHFGLKHEVFTVGPQEVLAVLPMLASAYDEPYSNSSAIPCYYCAKVSRDLGDEMILAGDGGDELFGGNTRYLKDGVFDHYQRLPLALRKHLFEQLLMVLPWAEKVRLLRRAKGYVDQARRSVADRMTRFNAFAFAPAEHIFSREAFAGLDLEAPRRFAEDLYNSAAGDAKIQKMMHLDLQLTLADSDLRKVMKTCDVAGIRVRFPMLDDELAAFSASLPPSLLTENGEIRRFYKDAVTGFLPDEIIRKPKQGFGLPMFHYITESSELADFFCDALSDLKQWPMFSAGFLDQMIDEVHRGNPGTHAGIVWDLAVLGTWMSSRRGAGIGSGDDLPRVPTHA